jgi:hypothetical protein
MPVEAEILAAGLTRMKTLIDALERACRDTEAVLDTFRQLKTRTRSGTDLGSARSSVRDVDG